MPLSALRQESVSTGGMLPMDCVSTSVQITKCTWPVAPRWSLHAMTDTTTSSRLVAIQPLTTQRRVASVQKAPPYSTQSMRSVSSLAIVLDLMGTPKSLETHGRVAATPASVTRIP